MYFSYPVSMQHHPFLCMHFCKPDTYCHIPHTHLLFFILMISVNGSLSHEDVLPCFVYCLEHPCPFLQTLNCNNRVFFSLPQCWTIWVSMDSQREEKNQWLVKHLFLPKFALPQCTGRRKMYTAHHGEGSGLYPTSSMHPFSNLATLTSLVVILIHTYPSSCKNENVTPHCASLSSDLVYTVHNIV